MILRIVRMSFSPDKIQDFIKIFNESKTAIEASEGCFNVKLYVDHEHSNVYYTKSKWISPEALEKYRQSDLFKSTWARTKVLFNDSAQAHSLVLV